jgi:hypothetical protein
MNFSSPKRERCRLVYAPVRMNAADERLLALYPRWRVIMAEWDATSDRVEETDYAGYALHRQLATVSEELRTMEAQIIGTGGFGPIGAIAKLSALRTMARSGTTDAIHAATAEAIAVLAKSIDIEPYDYEASA